MAVACLVCGQPGAACGHKYAGRPVDIPTNPTKELAMSRPSPLERVATDDRGTLIKMTPRQAAEFRKANPDIPQPGAATAPDIEAAAPSSSTPEVTAIDPGVDTVDTGSPAPVVDASPSLVTSEKAARPEQPSARPQKPGRG